MIHPLIYGRADGEPKTHIFYMVCYRGPESLCGEVAVDTFDEIAEEIRRPVCLDCMQEFEHAANQFIRWSIENLVQP